MWNERELIAREDTQRNFELGRSHQNLPSVELCVHKHSIITALYSTFNCSINYCDPDYWINKQEQNICSSND